PRESVGTIARPGRPDHTVAVHGRGETGELSGRRMPPAAVRAVRQHALVLVAAHLAVLLAATVLAALAALTEQAVEGGAQRRLAGDPDAVIGVSGPCRQQDAGRVGGLVRDAVDRAFGGVPHHTWSALRVPAARSAQPSLTEAAGRRRDDTRVSLAALQHAARHTTLVAGRLPRT